MARRDSVPPTLHVDGAVIDLEEGTATRGARTVRLTRQEVRLLAFLAARAPDACTRAQIHAEVLGYTRNVVSRAADKAVFRLRAKLEIDRMHPRCLVTVDDGYRLLLADRIEETADHLLLARLLLQAGDLVAAEAHALQATKEEAPARRAEAFLVLGVVATQRSELVAAESCLLEVIRITDALPQAPSRWKAFLDLGIVALRRGDRAAAGAHFGLASDAAGDDATAIGRVRISIAGAELDAGDVDAAGASIEALLQRAVEARAFEQEALLRQLAAAIAVERHDLARAAREAALSLIAAGRAASPQRRTGAWLIDGWLAHVEGRRAAAIEHYGRVIEAPSAPPTSVVDAHLGLALLSEGDERTTHLTLARQAGDPVGKALAAWVEGEGSIAPYESARVRRFRRLVALSRHP